MDYQFVTLVLDSDTPNLGYLKALYQQYDLGPILWRTCLPESCEANDYNMAKHRSYVVAGLRDIGLPVVLVGSAVVRLWRPDVQLSKVHGQWFRWNDRIDVYPIYAPKSAVQNPETKAVMDRDIRRFAFVSFDRLDERIEVQDLQCSKPRCTRFAANTDFDYVPYCKGHWNYGKEAKAARSYWNEKGDQQALW